MAKGTDSEEFVVMSESETGSGFKRDYSSLFNNQPDDSLVRKSNGILEYSRKRFRKFKNKDFTSVKTASPEEQPVTGMSEDLSLMVVKNNVPAEEEMTKNLVSPMDVEDNGIHISSAMEVGNDLVIPLTIKEEPKSNEEKVVHEEVRSRRVTRSANKSDGSLLVVDGGNATKNVGEKDFRDLVVCLRSPNAPEETSRVMASSTIKTPKRCTESAPTFASATKPPLRFTHSALSTPVQIERVDVSLEAQKMLESRLEEVLIDDDEGILNTSSDKSSCMVKIEHTMVEYNREAQDASTIKPKRFPRIAMECMTEPRGVKANSKVHSTILDTPGRRFTRSALACEKEPQVMDEVRKVEITSPERPLRRFTRSTLNIKDEPTEVLAASISSGNGALLEKVQQNKHTENCFSRTTNDVSQIRTPAHKKLEMKMSKKIELKRFPGKISELLETGMLEGLSVKYVCRAQQIELLKGTIKGRGILCSCTLCKGCKVVTATEFERHAGSGNKNPAHYIYMDNGNSLYDVLIACKDAPLDILEATIQMAIKSPAIKNALCLSCKRPTGTRRTLQLCDSCLKLKRPARTVARSKQPSTPKESVGAPKYTSPQSSTRGKLTRKDLRLHKLVFEEDGLPDGTELAYYTKGQKLLEGYKKGHGIFCFCCNNEISPSQFEAHAGWATRRKPYLNIYTSNGVSLHELSISLSKGRKFSAKDNDDLCGICADFGDLLLCDGCPRAFHKDCIGEPTVPRGKWYCPYCQEVFQKDQACAHNANAVAAGRISGVDPIEQISKRCIRIVKTPENEVGGCVLCRIPGFSKSGFGPRTIILCDQCEKEFHVGCLRDHKIADLKVLPKGKWFCSKDCSRINNVLDRCVLRGPEELPPSITKSIKTMPGEELEISWRLLSGKVASPESRSLLSKAVTIFHNRFDPIVDTVTGRDLIPCMVYGRSIRNQDFGGMFCAVLTVNSCVVSAGLVRVLGQEMAELPLVATSSDHQGRGYFQSLFTCIERLMGFLNVKNLVLPAAEEAEAIWTDKFGFRKLSLEQMKKYRKDYQMTVFRETPVLYKPVPKCRIVKTQADGS
ncbi:hypothetical protein ACHQM5_010127 [Ranunculus cassubicifolius]